MRTLAAATALLSVSLSEAFIPITRTPAKLVVQRASYSGSAKRLAPMMARKPFIAGNWKLNPATVDEAVGLAKAVSTKCLGAGAAYIRKRGQAGPRRCISLERGRIELNRIESNRRRRKGPAFQPYWLITRLNPSNNQQVAAASTSPDVEVAVVAPFPFLVPVQQALGGSKVALGAQDLYTEDKGAFTGAVATSMIKSVGAQWVLCGHSERRA